MSKPDLLLDQIIAKLRHSHDVHAVWLAGSRGRGTADEFSDIDIWIALDDDHIAPVIDDPLTYVHNVVPTIMHILAPSIAPGSGAFIGTWIPSDDEFVQVDWYFAPASTAKRDVDTVAVFGEVPLRQPLDLPALPQSLVLEKAEHNLALAMQSINNMVKNGRRGRFWDVANNARNGDRRLHTARSLLETGNEPGLVASQESLLSGPPPTTVRDVQELAVTLLEEVSSLGKTTRADFSPAISAMRTVIRNWRETGWKPTEEYYRTLPRRYMGAGMLFTDVHDNILLLETTYRPLYEIPGGVAESGEPPRETARREVREELGIDIEPGPLLIFDTRSQPAPKGDAIMLVYDGGVIDDPSILTPDGDEIAQVRFTPIDQLDQFCKPQMATRIRAAIRARNRGRTIEIVDGKIID